MAGNLTMLFDFRIRYLSSQRMSASAYACHMSVAQEPPRSLERETQAGLAAYRVLGNEGVPGHK